MTELATTYVRIRPRTTGFKTEADEKLGRQKPKDVEVQVSADTRSADERLSLLKDRLDTLRLRTTEARVALSGDDRALGRLAEIDAAMIRLDRARANPKIDLEGVAKAEAQLATLNAQLDRLGERRAGGGGGGILSRIAGFGQGGFFGGKGLLGVGLAAGSVPLGIGAAGLGAGLLSPSVAGLAGLGLFGAASKSSFSRVGKVQKQLTALNQRIGNTPQTITHTTSPASAAQIAAAQARLTAADHRFTSATTPAGFASARASVLSAQSSLAALQGRGGSTTTANKTYQNLVKQRQQLLKQLTPAERDAAKGLEQLEHTWKHFQRALEPQSFKLLATGTDIFRKGLHDLLPMTAAVGDSVDHLAKRADNALSDPFWHNFFGTFLTTEAPRAVHTLGTVLGNVVTGFAHLAVTFAPLGHDLEHGVVSLSAKFDKWTQGGGPVAFMHLVQQDGPIVAKALVGIAHGLEGVGMGLEPIGRIELQALTPVLDFVGTLGKQHPGVITALGVAYLGIAGGLKAIGAVKGITGALNTLRTVGGLRGPKGTGGDGGFLGLGKAGPVHVWVDNPGFKGGEPGGGGGAGGAATTVEKDAEKVAATGGVAATVKAATKEVAATVSRLAGPLALTYAAVAGGDQARGQTPLGASMLRNGPAITSLIAGVGPRVPSNIGADFFSGDASSPGGRAVDPQALAKLTLAFGTPAQVAQLKEIAKTYPSIASAIKVVTGEQQALAGATEDGVANTKKAIAASAQYLQVLERLGPRFVAQAQLLGGDLGKGLITGIEAQIPHTTVAGKLLVSATVKAMRLQAQTNSPSKVTRKVGQDMGQGLVLGLMDKEKDVQKQIAKLGTDLANLRSSARGLASGVRSAILGDSSILNTPNQSIGGIIDYFTHVATVDTSFEHRIRRLRHAGVLPKGLVNGLELAGPTQAGNIVKQLARASTQQDRHVANLFREINQGATQAGQAARQTVYDPQITKVVGELHGLRSDLHDLAHEVRGAQHKALARVGHP